MVNIVKQNYAENVKKYRQYEHMIYETLGNDVSITHVGSTAIPHMYGKNIIDILIGINDINQMDTIHKKINSLGFFDGQNKNDKLYCFFASRKEETQSGDVHIHLVYTKTNTYKDFVLLKEYLLKNPKVAMNYAKFKLKIVNTKTTNRETYKKIKNKYVEKLLKQAYDYQRRHMPISITLVRHGENATDDTLDNSLLPLTNKGIEQATWAKRIINDDFDIVWSSISKRAHDTAKIIASHKIIYTSHNLLECGYGNKEHDGKETKEEARKRFRKVINNINKKYPHQRILIVAHGSLIKIAQDVIENTIATRKTVENCSIIKYTKEEGSLYYCHKYYINPFEEKMVEDET